MSTYVKAGKNLEYDNAPDWLINYMRYRTTVLANTPKSIMTYFLSLREFFQWAWAVAQNGRQPQTEEALRQVYLLDMPLQTALDLSRNDIETYLYFLADILRNEASTRNRKLATISTFYDYLYDQQEVLGIELAGNPAARVRRPKQAKNQPVYLPEEDQIAFLEAISGENAVRDYAIFLLLLSAGLRISELVGIDIRNLNLSAQTIRIRGKGNKERIAYLTVPCCKALQDYIEQYRDQIPDLETDALFVSKRYKNRITTRSVEQAMQKHILNAKLGGNGYTPHKLRHTTGTTLAKDGVDLLVIQQVLGHENPATTEIYTHLGQDDIARAVKSSSLEGLGNSAKAANVDK